MLVNIYLYLTLYSDPILCDIYTISDHILWRLLGHSLDSAREPAGADHPEAHWDQEGQEAVRRGRPYAQSPY